MDIASPSSELIMDCHDSYSCARSVIHFDYSFTDVSRIDCSRESYTCQDMTVYINQEPNVTNLTFKELDLQLTCAGTDTGCDGLTFHCNNKHINMTNYLVYDSSSMEFVCVQNNPCCYYHPISNQTVSEIRRNYPSKVL